MLGTQEQRTKGMKRQAQELIEEAYNRGYNAGQENALAVDSNKYREQGRDQAWEAAKYCVNADEARQYNYAFDGCIAKEIFENYTASEAIEKIRAYETQKPEDDEIHVGDEVLSIYDLQVGIVTYISNTEWFNILWKDGSVSKKVNISDFKKTGRTFPEIVQVLAKMNEGE